MAPEPALLQSEGAALADLLDRAARTGYDLTVVDTAPHSSEESAACARLCDRVYIPTRPAILDLDAIGASTRLAAVPEGLPAVATTTLAMGSADSG